MSLEWEMASQYIVSWSMLHNILFKAQDSIFHVFFIFMQNYSERSIKYFFKNVLLQINTSDSVGVGTQLYRIPC